MTSIFMQIADDEFEKNISASTAWYQNPCRMLQFSYMPDQILGKNEKGPKFDLSLGSFPPKT